MSEVTVKQLASTVGIPVERLLTQLNEAGIHASGADATLTEQEKLQLLGYLRRSHGKEEDESGAAPTQVTLKRKSVSELRQPTVAPRSSTTGVRPPPPARGGKTVSVEVRRKRTYVKRGDEGGTAPSAPSAGPSAAPRRPSQPGERSRPARERPVPGSSVFDEARRRTALEATRAEQESRRLADHEEQARVAREEDARRRVADEARRAEEEIRRRAEEEALRQSEREAASRPPR